MASSSRGETEPTEHGPSTLTSIDHEDEDDLLKDLPEIKKFYRLPGICKNAKSGTKGKNCFEYFKDSTYDSYSISSSFYISPTRLAGWIHAIQEVVYKSIGCDDNYSVKWRNKDRPDGAFVETELKVKQKKENGDLVHGSTIHMYLTTGTITFKDPMFHNFVDSNFKEMKQITVKTLQDKEDERCTLETIPETEAPAQSKLDTPVDQEIEHSNPRVSPLHLDDQHSESDSSSVTGIFNYILTSMNKFNVETILINLQDDYKRMSTTVNQLSEKFRKMERRVYSKIDTLSKQIPSKEPSENSKNKEKDDRVEDLMNANSSLKHQVDILNSEIDNKNKKIKQSVDQKTAMNQEMLNREKAIGELKIQLGRKDIEQKMLQEKGETNQVNKLKDESYQIKLENSSLHSIVSQPSKCLKFMTFREGCFVIRN